MEKPILNIKSSFKKPILCALATGLLAALFTLPMPNYYVSITRMLPVDNKSGGGAGNLANAAAALGFNVPGSEGSDANFVDILNSRWLREQLLQTEFHYHLRAWSHGQEQVVQGTLQDYLGSRNRDQALLMLGGVLSASRDIKSKVISVSAETRSPELSQAVVGRAVKLLETFLQEKGHTRGSAKAIFAEARLAEARVEMSEAEASLGGFLQGNRNYQTSTDPTVRLKGLRLETELRLRQQLMSAIAMNREQALLEEKNDIPILNVLDTPNLPIDKSRPVRSGIVMLVAFLTCLGAWGWFNRSWIQSRLVAEDDENSQAPARELK